MNNKKDCKNCVHLDDTSTESHQPEVNWCVNKMICRVSDDAYPFSSKSTAIERNMAWNLCQGEMFQPINKAEVNNVKNNSQFQK